VDVLPDDPTRVLQPLRERRQAGLTFRVVGGEWREHADAPHSVRLLGAGGERVRRRATESSDEFATPHGLRSSAEDRTLVHVTQKNAVVHHSKIDREMAEAAPAGFRPAGGPPGLISRSTGR
jgi:hypothetical protein